MKYVQVDLKIINENSFKKKPKMCPTAIDVLLFIMLLNNGNVKVFVGAKKITFSPKRFRQTDISNCRVASLLKKDDTDNIPLVEIIKYERKWD